MSDNAPCRVLAAQLTGDLILSKNPPPLPSHSVLASTPINVYDYTIEHKPFTEIVRDVLVANVDEDHMVRVQAVGALGNFTKPQWFYLHALMVSNIADNEIPLHIQVVEMLLQNCSHKVGTVKMAAHRALGEGIINCALPMDNYRACTATDGSNLVTKILEEACAGCTDTKLAVRLQAVWLLGNLILTCLRYRHMINNEGLSTHIGYITDEMWTKAYNVCKVLSAKDSDKILPSAARCIGFLAGGLKYTKEHRAILHEIIEMLVSTRFGCDLSLENGKEIYIEDQITTISHKLSSAICQALGFVGKALAKHHYMSFTRVTADARSDNMYEDNLSKLELIKLVLSVMLKKCKPKIQLQACKGLINLYVLEENLVAHMSTTASMPLGSSSVRGESLFIALDAALISTSTINTEAIDENTVVTKSLREATLLLISVIVQNFDEKLKDIDPENDEDLKQKLLVVLLHHIDGLVEWLEKYTEEKNEGLTVSSFMLTLPSFDKGSDMLRMGDKDDMEDCGHDEGMLVDDVEMDESALLEKHCDGIDPTKDKSTTHETVVKISKMLYNIITHTSSSGSVSSGEKGFESMLPTHAMSKLIWLVAADTRTFLSFAPFATSHTSTSPTVSKDKHIQGDPEDSIGMPTSSTYNDDDADLDINNLLINVGDFDDNDEI